MVENEEIIQKIESYLSRDNVFDFFLQKKLSLYEDKLTDLFENDISTIPNIKSKFYFKCNPSYISFEGEPVIRYLKSRDYDYLYIRDFIYNGVISQNDYKELDKNIDRFLDNT